MNHVLVYRIVTENLDDLRAFVRAVVKRSEADEI